MTLCLLWLAALAAGIAYEMHAGRRKHNPSTEVTDVT